MKNKSSERITVLFISIILIIALTVACFFIRQNYLFTNRERLIIFAYQTNLGGSDCEEWAKHLKTRFPDVPDFEITPYLTHTAGTDTVTVLKEDGWSQIVTRLGAGQGDILFVNNKVFYDVLLKNKLLIPLDDTFSNGILGDDGNIYGIDVTDLKTDGLLNLGTSEHVGFGERLPIKCVDNAVYKRNGIDIEPRVIAVVYAGTKYPDTAKNILKSLFSEV